MKFLLSLVLVAFVATVVESTLKETMDSLKKLTGSDSYSSPSYSSPSYSAPSYSAPSYSAPSYSAPSYQQAQPIYVIKPESREYVTEVHKVKHVPVYPARKYKTKHYSKGYDSGDSYSSESNEYGTYNSGGHMIYRRDAPEPSGSAKFWQNLAQKPGNGPHPGHPVGRRSAPRNSRSSEEHGNNGNHGNNGHPGNNGNNGHPGNNGNPGQNEPWRG